MKLYDWFSLMGSVQEWRVSCLEWYDFPLPQQLGKPSIEDSGAINSTNLESWIMVRKTTHLALSLDCCIEEKSVSTVLAIKISGFILLAASVTLTTAATRLQFFS